MISDESAKAVQESAKLGQKGLDVASEAGGFFAKTFGQAIAHVAEAFADKAAAYRVRNRASVVAKTRTHLERLGVEDFKAIDFRNGIPLLEGISEEPEESLQEVWASYLANALNPNSRVKANRQLIDIIRKLEPGDLPILSNIHLNALSAARSETLVIQWGTLGVDADAIHESLARLTALGLFSFQNGPDLLAISGPKAPEPCRITVETPLGEFHAQPLLMFLKLAIEMQG